jgi:hypothetical protein
MRDEILPIRPLLPFGPIAIVDATDLRAHAPT